MGSDFSIPPFKLTYACTTRAVLITPPCPGRRSLIPGEVPARGTLERYEDRSKLALPPLGSKLVWDTVLGKRSRNGLGLMPILGQRQAGRWSTSKARSTHETIRRRGGALFVRRQENAATIDLGEAR